MTRNAEMELLSVLTDKLRVASQKQLLAADARWNKRMIRRLIDRRLIASTTIAIGVIDAGGEPYARWQPNQAAPDSGSVSYMGRRRIREALRQSVLVIWATGRAASLVGGIGGKLRQPWQVQHDLGVASIYFHFRRYASEKACRWISEDIYRRDIASNATEKVADAFLLSDARDIELAIELVGDYSSARLRAFHEFWSNRQIPYEWR
jgi:hypothetical protein